MLVIPSCSRCGGYSAVVCPSCGRRDSGLLGSLRAAVDADPTDPHHRLVLADWLEENGDQVAADCWRWTVADSVCPEQEDASTWLWRRLIPRWSKARPANLPEQLFYGLPEAGKPMMVVRFGSAATAWDALITAWRSCVAAGVNPVE